MRKMLRYLGRISARPLLAIAGACSESLTRRRLMSARRGGIAAATSFTESRRGVERHIEIEERELLPAVEGGPETVLTATLRKDQCDLLRKRGEPATKYAANKYILV
jgi:hypothetical protein